MGYLQSMKNMQSVMKRSVKFQGALGALCNQGKSLVQAYEADKCKGSDVKSTYIAVVKRTMAARCGEVSPPKICCKELSDECLTCMYGPDYCNKKSFAQF